MINIIIPHYKHQCYLPDAIDGMLRQHTWLGDLDSIRQIGGWRLLIFNDEPDIDISDLADIANFIYIFQDGKNKGQAARFNEGIKLSLVDYQADWIMFHGADDISMYWRNKIFAEYRRDADVLYTDAVQLNANNQRTYIKSEEFNIEELKRRNFIVASTVFVRTELAAKVLFDEDLRYGEDWLFYHKLYKAGARFRYIPIPTMYYRDYTSNIGVRYGPEWDANREKVIDRVRKLYK